MVEETAIAYGYRLELLNRKSQPDMRSEIKSLQTFVTIIRILSTTRKAVRGNGVQIDARDASEPEHRQLLRRV